MKDAQQTEQAPWARKAVAAEVRAMAARFGYNQTAVAKVIGMTQPNAGKRLRGELPFDIDELAMLAAEWDIPITKFMPDTEDLYRPPVRPMPTSRRGGRPTPP